jgi:steroid 5-alpha reductase family enzyme
MSAWALFLLAWALAAGLQLVLYLDQRRTGKATAVDAGWAASLVGIALLYAFLGGGAVVQRVLVAVLVTLELGRVTILVARRVGGEEDGRYRELRERWRARGREQASFLVFFQAQALLAAILSLPWLVTASNDADRLEPLEWAGAAVWLAGFLIGLTADRQLARFRADPANRGKTARIGLWRYSRHPNYFGQWLTWLGYGLIALAAPWGWIGLLAPALMLYLILFVTGIPPTEEQALKSRGEDYRRYQRETSAFVPWFPKAAA